MTQAIAQTPGATGSPAEPAPLPGPEPGGPPSGLRARIAATPLSIRLSAIICLLLLLGLAVFGIGANVALRAYLTQQVDDQLRSQMLRVGSGGGMFGDALGSPRGPTDYAQGLVKDVTTTTEITWQLPPSKTVQDTPNISVATTIAQSSSRMPGWHGYQAPSEDGKTTWRAMSAKVTVIEGADDGSDSTGTVTIAVPMTGINTTLARMRLVIIWAAVPIVLLGTLAGYWLVRRSLRPLKQVETTAAAIAAGDLTQRVPPAPRGTEVGELTASLNGMLSQIEQAFDAKAASEARMRQFVSDASHELRTPLASIRGYGELYRMGAIAKKREVSEAMRRIEQESTRMGTLVEDLLQLARLDEGRPLRRLDVDLTHVALDASADVHAIAPDRQIQVLGSDERPLDADDAVIVVGDEDRVRQIVTNLLTNACHHTPESTPIELLVSRTESAALLQVRDHGPGIPHGQAVKVFERFYRTDTSRTRASGGSGLGLAIVASLVAAHGGGVDVIETPGGGATFRVTLPLVPSPPADGHDAPHNPSSSSSHSRPQ